MCMCACISLKCKNAHVSCFIACNLKIYNFYGIRIVDIVVEHYVEFCCIGEEQLIVHIIIWTWRLNFFCMSHNIYSGICLHIFLFIRSMMWISGWSDCSLFVLRFRKLMFLGCIIGLSFMADTNRSCNVGRL